MASILDEHTQFIDSTTKAPLVDGKVWFGVAGADPTISTTPIFSDRALSSALANPQDLDASGRTLNKVYIPGRYSIAVYDVLGNLKYQNLDNGEAQGSETLVLSSILGTNAITGEATPTITSYFDNAEFVFEVLLENTTDAVTLDIDGLGAKAIKRSFDLDVGKGRFKVGQKVVVIYNEGNDNFELVNDNRSVIFVSKGADIASATTVDLSAATGNALDITGFEGPITSFGTVKEGVEFELTFPGPAAINITSSTVASPTNILCAAPHGFPAGTTNVEIEGHTGSVPDINGLHVATFVDAVNFTIPVNVTTGGTGGAFKAIPVITNNDTSMQCPASLDVGLRSGDGVIARSLGSGNFKIRTIFRKNGGVQVAPTKTQAEAGTNSDLPMTAQRVAQAINGYGGRPEAFVADGTYAVPDGISQVLVELQGGGAGGGGASVSLGGAGGGAGGFIRAVIPVTPGGTEAVVVGLGGAGNTGVGSGTAGGNSTVGSTKAVANGGAGGGGQGGAVGAGGSFSTSGTAMFGDSGNPGLANSSGTGGAGGAVSPSRSASVSAATNLGDGGEGGTAVSGDGGAGLDGYVIITPLI